MKFFLVLSIVCAIATVALANASSAERAQKMLERMTLEEKVSMLHGITKTDYIGEVKGNERLGIPRILMNDGPQGFRSPTSPGSTTAWPAVLNLGASWDADLCRKFGEAMGEEFYNKGANVALGPGMNLARVPVNGRVFEYISGGDGYLGAKLVGPVIQGIQSKNVIANAKHWVNNNQETNRATVDSIVDDRTRYEMYYEPFQGAVDAGVGSFMCSYNKINGAWSCENPETLGKDLKKGLGFDGWVMSDWGATHSTSIEQGLDQEMPGATFMGRTLLRKVRSGEIPTSAVDESVLRILTPMYEIGVMDDKNPNDLLNDVRTPEHEALAAEISASSHVLLQNEKATLPIQTDGAIKIAVIGKMSRLPIVGGGGSGQVYPAKVVSPYEGIMTSLGMADKMENLSVNCTMDSRKNIGFQQSSCISFNAPTIEDCSDRCATFNGCHKWTWVGGESIVGGHCLFTPTDAGAKPMPGAMTGTCEKTQPEPQWQCNDAGVCVAVTDGSDIDLAKKLASEADVSVVTIGTSSGEGNDRETLSFKQTDQCQLEPKESQDDLVEAVAAISASTVVAMVCPGACLTPWRGKVESILHGFLPGEAYGTALASILFGKTNPSAKLPLTMPNVENEVGFTESQYPGIDKVATYSEGMLIDYRWYTANEVTPAFPFGFGLSYTTFGYDDLKLTPGTREFTCVVSNTGDVAGSEVAQLYLTFPKSAKSPPLQLKGFVKTDLLEPGAQQKVTFTLRDRDLSVWDEMAMSFVVVKGDFLVQVGSSSADMKLSATYTSS